VIAFWGWIWGESEIGKIIIEEMRNINKEIQISSGISKKTKIFAILFGISFFQNLCFNISKKTPLNFKEKFLPLV